MSWRETFANFRSMRHCIPLISFTLATLQMHFCVLSHLEGTEKLNGISRMGTFIMGALFCVLRKNLSLAMLVLFGLLWDTRPNGYGEVS